MELHLDPIDARVLGCLIEKDLSTPEYYPLTLNALVNACNQKSNRDPVMAFSNADVEESLQTLRANHLATIITGPGLRVPKYEHRCGEVFNLTRPQLAVMAELMVRGRQTPGELNSRSERMHQFADLDEVLYTLDRLAAHEPEPLVKQLNRQAGFKEPRWTHLLSGDVAVDDAPSAHIIEAAPRRALEEEVRQLREDFSRLRDEFDEFRRNFE
ncbi:MAG: YceH family protein [Acidobacteria bacterium]|nr:YceH family protein [Acidobacteriota bacterium]